MARSALEDLTKRFSKELLVGVAAANLSSEKGYRTTLGADGQEIMTCFQIQNEQIRLNTWQLRGIKLL